MRTSGEGVKKSENIADIVSGSSQRPLKVARRSEPKGEGRKEGRSDAIWPDRQNIICRENFFLVKRKSERCAEMGKSLRQGL